MSKSFEIGKEVGIGLINHNEVCNGEYVVINGKLLHIPNDTGDLFIIELQDGTIRGYNPNCSNFVCISQ